MKIGWGKCGAFVFPVLLVAVVIAAFQYHGRPTGPSNPPKPQADRSGSQTYKQRRLDPLQLTPVTPRLYPYSVIPGGLSSADELRAAIKNDPVVARHYADFEPGEAKIVALKKPLLAYVSYRIGDDVFWTRQKVRLPAGETVVSTGANLARTRCGNRISTNAQLPTSAKEPSSEALEAALQPAFVNSPEHGIEPLQTADPRLLAAESAMKPEVIPHADVETPSGADGLSVAPLWGLGAIPVSLGMKSQPGNGTTSTGSSGTGGPTETSPVNISEPSTAEFLIFTLLLAGLVAKSHAWRGGNL